MTFPKKVAIPKIAMPAMVKLPSMPSTAGGGSGFGAHTFSPGHDAGMGGGAGATAADALNQSRQGRFGFGNKGKAL
jgi:hypothetical protein